MVHMGSTFYDDDEDDKPTSISIMRQTAQIFTILKSRSKLPAMESVIQWMFANLSTESRKEVEDICEFLRLPHPFKNTLEVQREYNTDRFALSDDEMNRYSDKYSVDFIKEFGIKKAKTTEDSEIEDYVSKKIDSERKTGISTAALRVASVFICTKFRDRLESAV